jgi:hypothetical protein
MSNSESAEWDGVATEERTSYLEDVPTPEIIGRGDTVDHRFLTSKLGPVAW